ncbi:LON peptidase substrate-binding domain-containing protein [Azospirillum sp. SYSU D00513]|uniref:LON peptidase substrate-binding domain-containing protein n=1 Tax=Azospirillum sp. SYSU D00513 TaxID=2812561 RepID=UPI001A97199A|nr:LON peptidase substrate-binding domain-containing protein [Azospirillum sp. SYSU D00513]
MNRNPFDPTFDRLPRDLPIFPLPGVLLLPRGRLPLNIFEPRYLAMVEDALGGGRMIGMVQPTDPGTRSQAPAVYGTGCAGRITSFTESEDGRFLITLSGVCRFDVRQELEGARGYRRVEADWDRYAGDLEEERGASFDRPKLLAGLRGYLKANGISVDWDAIGSTPDERLVTSLAMICPFGPGEKQALLEAPDLQQRAKLLIALIEMSILDAHDGDAGPHRH